MYSITLQTMSVGTQDLEKTTSESEGTAKIFLAFAFLIGFLFRCLFMTSAIIITILNKRTAQKMI